MKLIVMILSLLMSIAPTSWNTRADISTASLIDTYWDSADCCFRSFPDKASEFQYWPQAHALDVITDAYLRTGDQKYLAFMDKWFTGVKAMNSGTWSNVYVDDMEWIGLSILRMYSATHKKTCLGTVLDIWKMIAPQWNSKAGGGIAWKADLPESKNACSNGPAAILAARIYETTGDTSCLNMALRIYEWEKNTLLRNGLVLDHINARTSEIATWKFTYNQGTFIGAAVELYNITDNKTFLADAVTVADSTLARLTNTEGILRLEGANIITADKDPHLFKGIFIRYLRQLCLTDIDSATRERYSGFILKNTAAAWAHRYEQGGYVYFGPDWSSAPAGRPALKSQISGCILIETAATINHSQNGL